MGPAAAPGAGKGTGHAGEQGGTSTTASGKAVFAANCAVCHGALGEGGNGGPDLTAIPAAKVRSKVVAQVLNGGGGTPAFKGPIPA